MWILFGNFRKNLGYFYSNIWSHCWRGLKRFDIPSLLRKIFVYLNFVYLMEPLIKNIRNDLRDSNHSCPETNLIK